MNDKMCKRLRKLMRVKELPNSAYKELKNWIKSQHYNSKERSYLEAVTLAAITDAYADNIKRERERLLYEARNGQANNQPDQVVASSSSVEETNTAV